MFNAKYNELASGRYTRKPPHELSLQTKTKNLQMWLYNLLLYMILQNIQ